LLLVAPIYYVLSAVLMPRLRRAAAEAIPAEGTAATA
jgi:hypothetical protein